MTTMVALIGEQPLPNFLPVRHYHSEDVLFVYTERTLQTYERLKASLQNETNVYGLETDAYNVDVVVNALSEKLGEIEQKISYPLVFNFTGGTKMMSMAAYLVAKQKKAPVLYVQSEGKQTCIYSYTWAGDQFLLSGKEIMRECITLHDVLRLQLGEWNMIEPKVGDGGGHLFELAIAQALRQHSQDYEVLCGIKDKKNQMDIDLMLRYQNHIAIIEAKTGSKHARGLEGVKQLSNNMRYLAGTYTRQFLVMDRLPEKDQKTVCDLLKIQIISLLNYQGTETVLTQEDIGGLLDTIDKQMKN